MDETLQALETLVTHNCLTVAEALDKAYLCGHRNACKQLEPLKPVLVHNATSATSESQKQ